MCCTNSARCFSLLHRLELPGSFPFVPQHSFSNISRSHSGHFVKDYLTSRPYWCSHFHLYIHSNPRVSLPTCFHAAKEDETVENPSRDYIVKRQRRFDIFLKLQVQILVASDKDILRSTLLPPTLFSKLGNKHHDQIHSHWTLGVVIGLIKHGIYSNDLAFALSPVTSHVRITCLWWVERRGIKGGSWRYKVTVQSFACVFSRTSPCFLGPIWKTSRAVLIHFRWWSNTIHVEYLFFWFWFFSKEVVNI